MEGCSISKPSLTFVLLLSAILCINCDVRNYDGGDQAACHDHEREALLKFRSGLEYDSIHQVATWDRSTGDCCKWRGVVCHNQTGYVLELDLFPYLLRDHYFATYDASINKTSRLSGQLDPVLLKLEHLQFLDMSGNSFNGISIPQFFGSFKDLRYLNLSYSSFAGQIPHQLGKLFNLEQLDIHGSYDKTYYLSTSTLQWLKGMPRLKSLKMNAVNLSEVGNDWIQVLNNCLPFLYELDLSNCELREIATTITSSNFQFLRRLNLAGNNFVSKIPPWITNISTLESLDLSRNEFDGSIPHDLSEMPHLKHLNIEYEFGNLTGNCTKLLQGAWRSIESLSFRGTKIYGQLPSSIGNLTSLVLLDLSSSAIEGLPETITNPCSIVYKGSSCHATAPLPNLQVLNLRYNNKMSGAIPDWLGKLRSLEELDMSNCNLSGPIPSAFGGLFSLRILSLESNRLSGVLPTATWNLSRLEQLFLGSNSLMGHIGDAPLNQLKKLTHLDLSSSSIILHLASDWVPAFQLEFLNLEACSLGPSFPQWLITQKSLRALVLSSTSIKDSLPPWFWDFASPLEWLDLSRNKIKGLLPKIWNFSSGYTNFDLSNNLFSGPLPQTYFTPLPSFFSISDNQITGAIPNSICHIGATFVSLLNLSQNHIVGSIPAGLGNCSRLQGLDLSENYLAGELPSFVSKLNWLRSLRLANNQLSGTIPLSLCNASLLEILDLGENNFSGNLSPLVYSTGLRILRLRSNEFTGVLPPNISNMDRLQILDLSDNMLSGLIPKSIGEFATLTKKVSPLTSGYMISYPQIGFYTTGTSYGDNLHMSFKGEDLLYGKNLPFVAGIDLSKNDFCGEIPKELTRLKGLIFLNLSNNHFTGTISENIGELRWLEALDVSSNQLEGEIPSSFLQLTFLAKLNLSNNHLRGRIPLGGQLQILGNSSIYEGNIGLCGPPLEKQCVATDTVPTVQDLEPGKRDDGRWLYMGMMFGFVFGLWVFWGFLLFNKSMRIAFFNFFDSMMDELFFFIVICLGKVKTRV